MLPIQIFLLAFFLVAVIKVISRYHYNELSFKGAVAWVIFWLLGGWIVVDPDSTFFLARAMGVGRGADAVVYVGMAGLFFMIFRLMIKIEKLNKDISSIVRAHSLKEKK